MGALKDTVQSKTAVPTAQVYVRLKFINNAIIVNIFGIASFY